MPSPSRTLSRASSTTRMSSVLPSTLRVMSMAVSTGTPLASSVASVREGEGISKPLRQGGRFPPIVTHMIAVGERTGQLEEMLIHVADAYDQQIEVRVGVVTSVLEPLLIVVMGAVVGGIAFAILMPLLQLNEMIQ